MGLLVCCPLSITGDVSFSAVSEILCSTLAGKHFLELKLSVSHLLYHCDIMKQVHCWLYNYIIFLYSGLQHSSISGKACQKYVTVIDFFWLGEVRDRMRHRLAAAEEREEGCVCTRARPPRVHEARPIQTWAQQTQRPFALQPNEIKTTSLCR